MNIHTRALIAGLLLVASAAPARGQAVDPSGHWQGSVQARGTEMAFAIDVVKGANGQFGGTLDFAAQQIKGLPLTKVAVDGTSLVFHARSDQPFTGVLSDNRQTITGDVLISGTSLPFVLTRSGDAAIRPMRSSAAIPKALVGRWTGSVVAEGVEQRLVMTLENRADGTGRGLIVNEDEGGLELPITIVQNGSTVTIETIPIASTLIATLNAQATELTGVLTQGPATAQVSFRRAQ